MKNWKTTLFGDNTTNFYGWLFTGLLICGVSAWLVWRALRAIDFLSTEHYLLLAIYILFVGQFCVAWHNYLARIAEKLDAPKMKETDNHSA